MKWHKWSNLKNNRDNKASMRELFSTYWDEVLVLFLGGWVGYIVYITIQGQR